MGKSLIAAVYLPYNTAVDSFRFQVYHKSALNNLVVSGAELWLPFPLPPSQLGSLICSRSCLKVFILVTL